MDWFRSSVPTVKLIRSNSSSSNQDSDRENTYDSTSYDTSHSETGSSFLRELSNYAGRGDRIHSAQDTRGTMKKQQDRRDDLICALCGEMYSDPRLLPCLHTFCRRCLEHTINPRTTSLTCHLCRKEATMKINGILEFPINFVVNNLLDIYAVQNSSTKPVLCSICQEQLPATARCIDCMDFLCFACHNAHSRVRVTKDHQILTIEQLKRSDDIARLLHRPVLCQTHSSEKVTHFCNTCQQTICRECVVSLHQANSHDFLPVEQAIETRKSELSSLYEVTIQKQPLIRSTSANLEQVLMKIDERYDAILREIHEQTPRLISLLKEKERSLISELDCVVEEKKNVLKKQLDQLNSENRALGVCNSFAEQVLSTGTEAEVLNLHGPLCDKLRELAKIQHSIQPEADDQIFCDTNIDSIANAVGNYGELSTNGEEFFRCSILGDIGTAVKGHTTQVQLVIRNQHGMTRASPKEALEVELRTPESGIIVPEIREKSDGVFILTYRTYTLGQHQLAVKFKGRPITGSPFTINVVSESSAGQQVPNVSANSGYGPSNFPPANRNELSLDTKRVPSSTPSNISAPQKSALSFNQPSTLEVSETNNQKPQQTQHGYPLVSFDRSLEQADGKRDLQRAQVESQVQQHTQFEHQTKQHTKFEPQTKPFESYREQSRDELPANQRPKMGAKFVLSFGRRGTHFGEFHGVFGLVTDHKNKRILATDCNNHRVQVFNESGQFLFSFGQKGYQDGEFQSPTGIGVGPNGEIIVCERLKGRIQIFDREGRFQRRFILNELKASTLTVDVAGRIIMADYTSCCIYILDPILERWSKFGYFGHGPGELQYPGYVTTDQHGNIYVSDMHSNNVQMYDSDSGFIRTFGCKGDKDGEFLRPTGIAVDMKGRLIVADRDNHRIQVLLPTGEFCTKFGTKGDHESDLNDTHGLTVLSDGKIAAADFRNNRIQVFSLLNDY